MTEFEEIQNWLNSDRNFDRGLMLYIAYFNDKDTRYLLERNRDAAKLFNVMRARYYELKQPEVKVAAASAQKSKTVIDEEPKNPTGRIPEDLRDRWKELKTEQERWHTEICLLQERKPFGESDRAQCAGLAKKIYDHQIELDALGMAMEYYKEHGMLPVGFVLRKKPTKVKRAPKLSKLNESEKILKLKNSINPGLSKLKKKIEDKRAELPSLTGKLLEKANAKLSEWETEQAELNAQKEEILNAQQ